MILNHSTFAVWKVTDDADNVRICFSLRCWWRITLSRLSIKGILYHNSFNSTLLSQTENCILIEQECNHGNVTVEDYKLNVCNSQDLQSQYWREEVGTKQVESLIEWIEECTRSEKGWKNRYMIIITFSWPK